MCKLFNTLLGVIHAHVHSVSLKLVDCALLLVFAFEHNLKLAFSSCYFVNCLVLIAECMSSDDNGTRPTWHQSGDILDDNRFSKNCSAHLVTDGAVGGSPHFLETEFCHSVLVRSNCSAFDADLALFYCVGCI